MEGIVDRKCELESKRKKKKKKKKRLWWWSLIYLGTVLCLVYAVDEIVSVNINANTNTVRVRVKKSAPLPLGFRSHDGTFKILQVADLHFGNGPLTRCRDLSSDHQFRRCSDLNSSLFFRRLLRAESPDLIAFTGDNIFGSSASDAAESLLAAFAPAIESGIPWAAVLGNHDHESTMDRPQLMFFLSLLDYSLSQVNPPSTPIDGFGNYHLRVLGAPGSRLANTSLLNLLFLDSGDRETVQGIRTYGWIKDSQLRWISQRFQVVAGLRKMQDDGVKAPALAFFHIPIPEMRQLYHKKIVGEFQEGVACSSVNSGVLRTLVSVGEVKAVFVGHDHKNDFCGNVEGIWFCYGGGFGYHGYGKAGWARRARVILAQLGKGQKEWSGVESIKTWKRLDDGELSKIDEQLLWVWESPQR